MASLKRIGNSLIHLLKCDCDHNVKLKLNGNKKYKCIVCLSVYEFEECGVFDYKIKENNKVDKEFINKYCGRTSLNEILNSGAYYGD